jgi:hypothetical protein
MPFTVNHAIKVGGRCSTFMVHQNLKSWIQISRNYYVLHAPLLEHSALFSYCAYVWREYEGIYSRL